MKKLIQLTDQQIKLIQQDAKIRDISFTEMLRRILDQHYQIGTSFTVTSNFQDQYFKPLLVRSLPGQTDSASWQNPECGYFMDSSFIPIK